MVCVNISWIILAFLNHLTQKYHHYKWQPQKIVFQVFKSFIHNKNIFWTFQTIFLKWILLISFYGVPTQSIKLMTSYQFLYIFFLLSLLT